MTEYRPKGSMELTARQREVLEFIRAFTRDNGYPPTLREIGVHFGWDGPNAAREHLRRLKTKGAIDWLPRHSRSIRILGGPKPPPDAVHAMERVVEFMRISQDDMKTLPFEPSTATNRERLVIKEWKRLHAVLAVARQTLERITQGIKDGESQLQPGVPQTEPERVQPGDAAPGAGGVPGSGRPAGVEPRGWEQGQRPV